VDDAVPADQMDDLVGRTATVDLLAGQVVVEDASTADPVPAPGESLVGVSLEASQLPDGLAPGDTVAVLAAPEEGAEIDPDGADLTTAQVYSVNDSEAIGSGTGLRSVTLIVPDDDADTVALHASADLVVLVEVAAGGGG
jgi:hypothetical protein